MSLAIQPRNGAMAEFHAAPSHSTPVMTFAEIWEMATYAAKSGMFGVSTPEQAFCLMMICQAKGLHPIEAMSRYHIVKNRPTMRADAMQAEFQARGGVIEILERTTHVARALFSHPIHQPKPVEFSFTMEDARAAQLVSKDGMYAKYPDTMLWWRLVAKAIRVIHPGIVSGIYSTEEMQDAEYSETPAARHVSVHAEASRAIAAADATVPGWDTGTPDTRPYHQVVTDAVNEVNQRIIDAWGDIPGKPADLDSRKIHGLLGVKAVNLGYADGPAPTKVQQAINFATKIYEVERQWVRAELSLLCKDYIEVSALALEAVQVKPEDISQEPREPGSDDADPDIDMEGF